jgi:2-polyprenyl-6-methoxyphenol hydroxylase-like FAD-dependent oxidoreductase
MNLNGRVLIIGGGIGGLVAALAMRRADIDVAVFEQAPELSEIGAGITLWTNAMKALQHLDAADRVCASGSIIERGELRSWRGEVLVRTPVGEIGRQLGAPSLCLHRAVLQQEMFRKLDQGIVHLNSTCIGIKHDSQGVTACFSNGRSERGAVLIGADGLRSMVRQSLFGSMPLRYLGHACYRGIVPFPVSLLPEGYAFESWGPGRRFGAIRLDSERIYWFANLSSAAGEFDPNPTHTLRSQFAGWHEPIPEITESAEHAPILRHDIYDLLPIRSWISGRVSLLGDAAHPMTPDLGQGACQAIEDSVVLAECLNRANDPITALREFERHRWRRVSGIVKRSYFQAWIGPRTNPLACRFRDFLMKICPAGLMERAYKMNVMFDACGG